jgi:hypothetical protein
LQNLYDTKQEQTDVPETDYSLETDISTDYITN